MSDKKGKYSITDIRAVEELPLPNDFMRYYPFACGQFECGVDLRINKMRMSEYVGTAVLQRKYKPKSQGQVNLRSVSKLFLLSDDSVANGNPNNDFGGLIPMQITATCNQSDRLTHLKFHKCINLPRQLITILSLTIKFYPYLGSITIAPRITNLVIYELSRLLEMSNITEICLDGCYVRNGNFELLLEGQTKLRILSLARCTLSDRMILLFAERLIPPAPASSTLTILNVASNRLTDKSAKAMASVLYVNRCLRSLNLSDNGITDDGAISIFKCLMEFPVTQDEITEGRERRFDYLKAKLESINALIEEISKEELEKARRQASKRFAGLSKDDMIRPSVDIKLSPKTMKNIFERATLSADSVVGIFVDPFFPVTKKGGVMYCPGNNHVHSLNIAYNSVSVLTLRKILEVLEYQKKVERNPKGLLNVNIEGNRFPILCPELVTVNRILTENASTKVVQQQPLLRRSAKLFASKTMIRSATNLKGLV